MKHILCAYDGSEQAERAFDLTIELASKFTAKVTVIAIARLPEPPEDIETEAVLENAQQHYGHLFSHLRNKVESFPPQSLDFKIAVGHPAEQIVNEAERLGVDHIVMGHRGHTLFHRWLLGSVAK